MSYCITNRKCTNSISSLPTTVETQLSVSVPHLTLTDSRCCTSQFHWVTIPLTAQPTPFVMTWMVTKPPWEYQKVTTMRARCRQRCRLLWTTVLTIMESYIQWSGQVCHDFRHERIHHSAVRTRDNNVPYVGTEHVRRAILEYFCDIRDSRSYKERASVTCKLGLDFKRSQLHRWRANQHLSFAGHKHTTERCGTSDEQWFICVPWYRGLDSWFPCIVRKHSVVGRTITTVFCHHRMFTGS